MGVEEEFRGFVAARAAALGRVARLLAADRGAAEDLLQSALVTTYVHWRSIREPDAAEAYARTVLARLATRGRRRRWRGEVPTDVLPERPGSDAYDDVDTADAVRRALATLTPQQRAVVVLRYYVQLPETEIAALLGCSPGTVKSRAHRGLQALRDGGLLRDFQEAPDA